MITVRTYISSEAANLDRALLGSEGIEAFVADEMLANADPAIVWASGGVRLMVAESDLDRAADILRQLHALDAGTAGDGAPAEGMTDDEAADDDGGANPGDPEEPNGQGR